ncbi:hypothetical protein HYR69_03580 [Candidatus Sumerlaeota bacterium]|nr:hypothetical protein [Candidatus Sumerlaeota bacterium]
MPYVERTFYLTSQRRGAYPINADSIAIPIAQFMRGWWGFLPFLLAFYWFALRAYPGAVSLFSINKSRPIWSVFWSLLFLAFIFAEVLSIPSRPDFFVYPLDIAQMLLGLYLALCFRSLLMFSAFGRRR